jgi:hypothetical protein
MRTLAVLSSYRATFRRLFDTWGKLFGDELWQINNVAPLVRIGMICEDSMASFGEVVMSR